jgi:hypothetical protein
MDVRGNNSDFSRYNEDTTCFIATFTSVAATQGIRLTKLNVNTECIINFGKTFDIANEPITEGINFEIAAESENADTPGTGYNGRRKMSCYV